MHELMGARSLEAASQPLPPLQRLRLGLVLLYCTVAVASLLALAWSLYTSRTQVIHVAERHLATLSRTLGEHVARTLDASRQAAETILEHPQFQRDFERRDTDALYADLRVRLKTLQHMRSWNVIDRDGTVLMSTFRVGKPDLPFIPTFKELGFPEVNRNAFYGLVGPKDLPREIVGRINSAMQNAIESPEVRKKLLDVGATPLGGSPEDFERQIREEFLAYKEIVEKLNLK